MLMIGLYVFLKERLTLQKCAYFVATIAVRAQSPNSAISTSGGSETEVAPNLQENKIGKGDAESMGHGR